jgi:hypothetical protein
LVTGASKVNGSIAWRSAVASTQAGFERSGSCPHDVSADAEAGEQKGVNGFA